MSKPEQSYNQRQIRKLLNLFDDSDLEAWCLDSFPDVFDQLTRTVESFLKEKEENDE